jgi:hypothetical protein
MSKIREKYGVTWSAILSKFVITLVLYSDTKTKVFYLNKDNMFDYFEDKVDLYKKNTKTFDHMEEARLGLKPFLRKIKVNRILNS